MSGSSSPRGGYKLAFIGTHGVGKTTLCYGLASRLKAKDVVLEVVHEVARRCPLPLNEQTSLASQSWILHTQLAEEVVASARYPVVLCDRSALDNYVYMLIASGSQASLETLLAHWMRSYACLVYVPVLGGPRPDGFRAIDPVFQMAVDERLRKEIDQRHLTTLALDPRRRDHWIEDVEEHVMEALRPAQLPLL